MIYGRAGGIVRLTRMATPADAKLENRRPGKQDRERCKIGYLMVGRFLRDEEDDETEERLFDIALLKADGGWDEIRKAAIAAGNTILGIATK